MLNLFQAEVPHAGKAEVRAAERGFLAQGRTQRGTQGGGKQAALGRGRTFQGWLEIATSMVSFRSSYKLILKVLTGNFTILYPVPPAPAKGQEGEGGQRQDGGGGRSRAEGQGREGRGRLPGRFMFFISLLVPINLSYGLHFLKKT